MARAKRASDDVYNARRRYRRQAERYEKLSEKATGVVKARYQAQAKAAIGKAMVTYSGKNKPQGAVKKVAERLGVTQAQSMLGVVVKGAKAGAGARNVSRETATRLVQESLSALAGNKDMKRDQMARDILSIGNVGSRFYGGLVDVWGKTEESRKHPNKAILEYFGKSSIMDVIEELEDTGIDIYTPTQNDDVYISVQLKLQTYVLTHRR